MIVVAKVGDSIGTGFVDKVVRSFILETVLKEPSLS